MSTGAPNPIAIGRWRLCLGKDAEAEGLSLGKDGQRIEDLVGFLFEEERGSGRSGGRGGSSLTVPRWVDEVNELFPREACEVLQKELVRRKGIDKLFDSPELLEKVEPNVELVKTILTHKELLNEKTRVLARKVIDKVVEELKRG